MPITILIEARDSLNVCFDGKAKIYLKQNISIGFLKIKVQYANYKEDVCSFGKNKTFPSKIVEEDVILFH